MPALYIHTCKQRLFSVDGTRFFFWIILTPWLLQVVCTNQMLSHFTIFLTHFWIKKKNAHRKEEYPAALRFETWDWLCFYWNTSCLIHSAMIHHTFVVHCPCVRSISYNLTPIWDFITIDQQRHETLKCSLSWGLEMLSHFLSSSCIWCNYHPFLWFSVGLTFVIGFNSCVTIHDDNINLKQMECLLFFCQMCAAVPC